MVAINEKIEKLKRIVQEYKFLNLKISKLDCIGNLMNSIVRLIPKSKYVYLDVGTSGYYLIDKDLSVYNIKAYGQKGYFKGNIDMVIEEYQEKIKFMYKREGYD